MGNAMRGGTCPLCKEYASIRVDDRQYRHRGDVAKLVGSGYEICLASGKTREEAFDMRMKRDTGRHRNMPLPWSFKDCH